LTLLGEQTSLETEMIELTDIQKRFLLHWGEMGTKWGINRTVAQVHALLYISPRPLDAEEITNTLAVARSNVSGSLRELQGWGIVKMVHVMNDRRDHFEALKEPWEMFRLVLDERKKREIDPTLAMLREAVEEMKGSKDEFTRERLEALRDFFETTTNWYNIVRQWPTATLIRFLKLGDKVLKLLPK
jgi:DNA-binding transcriptional regulator GbsR (MarR family)